MFALFFFFFLTSELVCNRMFDKYVCWPDGLPNTTVSVPCPWYLPWYHKGNRSEFKNTFHGVTVEKCNQRHVVYHRDPCWLHFLLKYTCMHVCVCAVQHGMVYQECDANGKWVTMENTSECDPLDSTPVRTKS